MDIVVGILFIIFVGLWIGGAIQTFQRNWVAALLLLLILTPIWAIWAFFEIFMTKPEKQPIVVHVKNID